MIKKRSSYVWLWLSISLLSAIFCNTAAAEIPSEQRDALDAIFRNNGSHNIDYKGSDIVELDEDDNVVGLYLYQYAENGGEIYNLPYLKRLHLHSTFDLGIDLVLSSDIEKLTNLEELRSYGVISGELPIELFDLVNLRELIIEPSSFFDSTPTVTYGSVVGFVGGVSGSLPQDIGKLINLEELVLTGLGGNRGLVGEIPASLGNLNKLKNLDLHNNQLEGELPSELANLTRLESIDLSWNRLGGEVPTSMLPLPSSTSLSGQDYSYNTFNFEDTNSIDLATAEALGLGRGLQLRDAKVIEVSGDENSNIYVAWQNYDWRAAVAVDISTVVEENIAHIDNMFYYDIDTEFDHSFGYAVYVENVQGAYEKVADIDNIETTSWQGDLSGVELAIPVEMQVRRTVRIDWHMPGRTTVEKIESTGPLSRMGSENDHVNYAPEFLNAGDVVLGNVDEPLLIPGWASNLDDGNGGSQGLRFELKALTNPYQNDMSPGAYRPVRYPHVSVPSGTLRFTPSALAYGESLVVFQLCDDGFGTAGEALCSEDAVFVIKASDERVRASEGFVEAPSFSMNSMLDVGRNYDFQEHLNWARDFAIGVQDAGTTPRFHTLWVTNSALFEIAPWVSYPSGTLRYKIKSGAEGESEIYIALEKTVGKSVYSDIAKISLAVGDDQSEGATPDTEGDSVGGASANIKQAGESPQVAVGETSAQGGGGGLSWLSVLLLASLRLSRRRSIC